MNKVVILSLDDIRHITMINIYTDYFEEHNIPYDIICLNRYNEPETKYKSATVYSYKGSNINDSKVKKFISYVKYRRFAINKLRRNNYGYIVVWGERTASVFSDYLIKCNSYCVNIRDIGFPTIKVFFNRLKKAIDYSDFSTWCAPRGNEYLPKHDYIIVLNQNKNLVKDANKEDALVGKNEPIRIGTIGYIRHIEPSKQLMKAFCNDRRYIIQFYGTGAEKLADYANEIGMKNIDIRGTFNAEETAELLNKTDVINSFCGDGKTDITIAIGSPIRYGYSTLLYKPAIVSPNTYISDKTKKLNIGFTVESFASLPDDFYNWYHSLKFEEFKVNCDRFNKEFEDSIDNLHIVCDKRIKTVITGEKQ